VPLGHQYGISVPWLSLIWSLIFVNFSPPYPSQKIKNDAAGRGWFSNMGAILAVKTELGMTDHELTT
jgi:hypothetical protein